MTYLLIVAVALLAGVVIGAFAAIYFLAYLEAATSRQEEDARSERMKALIAAQVANDQAAIWPEYLYEYLLPEGQ